MQNLNLTDVEIATLEACRDAGDWRRACDAIKRARKGLYPPDWWPRVMASGLAERVLARSGVDAKVHAEIRRPDGSWEPLR